MKQTLNITHFLFLTLFFALANQSFASSIISVSDAYIKASIPGTNITAAYMTLNNTSGKEVSLLKVTSDISTNIEIHSHSISDEMMRMRQVDKVVIKANSSVKLQPMGLHLMFFELTQKLTQTDNAPITLHFSDDTWLNLTLPVKSHVRLPVFKDQ